MLNGSSIACWFVGDAPRFRGVYVPCLACGVWCGVVKSSFSAEKSVAEGIWKLAHGNLRTETCARETCARKVAHKESSNKIGHTNHPWHIFWKCLFLVHAVVISSLPSHRKQDIHVGVRPEIG